jgi:hypothetical protein
MLFVFVSFACIVQGGGSALIRIVRGWGNWQSPAYAVLRSPVAGGAVGDMQLIFHSRAHLAVCLAWTNI